MRRHDPWIVKARQRVFSGGPIREIAIEHVVLPGGRELPDYYRIELGDFALVFATVEGDRVIVLKQYKHGLGRVCLAFPGGAIEAGEDPSSAARRELLEETGYVSDRWKSLGSFVTNSNQRCNAAHLFIACDCRKVSAPKAPDTEDPELVLMPVADLLTPSALREMGLASHVALLALATHPALLD